MSVIIPSLSVNTVWTTLAFIFLVLTYIGYVNYLRRKHGKCRYRELGIEDDGCESNNKSSFIQTCEKETDMERSSLVISCHHRTPSTLNVVPTNYPTKLDRCHEDKAAEQVSKTGFSIGHSFDGLQKKTSMGILYTGQTIPSNTEIVVFPSIEDEKNNYRSTSQNQSDVEARNVDQAFTNNSGHTDEHNEVESHQSRGQGSDETSVKRVGCNESNSHGQEDSSASLDVATSPMHQEFEMLSVRKQTYRYRHCPSNLQVRARNLAEAGFFYKGVGDQTACFFCGGVLKEWETNDEPWFEHARWFPTCSFLIKNKKQSFVNFVQNSLCQGENIRPLTTNQEEQQLTTQQQNDPNNQHTSTDGLSRSYSTDQRKPVYPASTDSLSRSYSTDQRKPVYPASTDGLSRSYSTDQRKPVHPQYSDLGTRENSLKESVGVSNPEMAKSGFFYKAYEDIWLVFSDTRTFKTLSITKLAMF